MNTAATADERPRDAFYRELPSRVSALAGLRADLRVYLRRRHVPPRAAADIVLCVQEAATNALRFSRGRRVEIAVWVAAREVHATVRDYGEGFWPMGMSSCPDAWRTEGRGLYLIQSLMDQVAVRCGDGAEVSMCRRLPRPAPARAA